MIGAGCGDVKKSIEKKIQLILRQPHTAGETLIINIRGPSSNRRGKLPIREQGTKAGPKK